MKADQLADSSVLRHLKDQGHHSGAAYSTAAHIERDLVNVLWKLEKGNRTRVLRVKVPPYPPTYPPTRSTTVIWLNLPAYLPTCLRVKTSALYFALVHQNQAVLKRWTDNRRWVGTAFITLFIIVSLLYYCYFIYLTYPAV